MDGDVGMKERGMEREKGGRGRRNGKG